MLKDYEVQVLAAAAAQTTQWLAGTMWRADLRLRLVNEDSIKRDSQVFVSRMSHRRKVAHWDWVKLFHSKVKYRRAWMFAIESSRGCPGPRAMCWGKLEVHAPGYVSIEYIERRPFARLSGLTAVTAVQFIMIVADAMGLDEARLTKPFPKLVPFYMTNLGMSRHPATGEVEYLFKKVRQ
jgi:hypothetical protein